MCCFLVQGPGDLGPPGGGGAEGAEEGHQDRHGGRRPALGGLVRGETTCTIQDYLDIISFILQVTQNI